MGTDVRLTPRNQQERERHADRADKRAGSERRTYGAQAAPGGGE